jgi:N-acetylneuraminate lyase
MPFYYYHVPALTSVAMDMVEFLELAEEKIPNLAGIKYTAATIHEYQACLNYKDGKYDILYGYDELLLPALAVGAKGAIGSTYTFAAPLYLKVMEHYNNNNHDEARRTQLASIEMVRCLVKFSPIPAQRAIMKMIGFDLGACRLPLQSLNDADAKKLEAMLHQVHFFDILEQCKEKQLQTVS